MARTLTPIDGYAIMTELGRQATGQKDLTVVDLSTYVSAGETVWATGKENVYNALGIVAMRTLLAARVYAESLALMTPIDLGMFGARLRKISFYSKDPLPSGYFNTNLFLNLADGFTNGQNPDGNGVPQSTKSQWEQHQAMPLEMNFAGSTTWQHCITVYERQFEAAFKDPVELAQFVAAMMTEHANDIKTTKEAFNRMTLIAKCGQCYVYDKGAGWSRNQAINLTSKYNAFYGTNYTSAQLRTTYLKDFLPFMVSTVKEQIDFLRERKADSHLPMTKIVNGVSYSVLRHTPRDLINLYLFRPLFRKAEALVMPEIFNPEYLDINSQYESVDYWQSNYSESVRPMIKARVPFYDKTTGEQTSSGDITLDYVVGLICDRDAMMTAFELEDSSSTEKEARKGYRNIWLTIAKNAITDPTENAILMYMNDEDVTPPAEGAQEG